MAGTLSPRRGKGFSSFSLGEKVADGGGRMRGLFKKLAKKAKTYDLAMQAAVLAPALLRAEGGAASGFSVFVHA